MATPKITHREFLIARAFLKGTNGNAQNTYLILAVVAWLRAMNKAQDKYWKSLKNLSAAQAGSRLAQKLKDKSAAGANKAVYKAILTRIRGKYTANAAMASQAADFILGIAKSNWDAKHYGYVAAKEGYWLTRDLPNGTKETIWVPAVVGKNPLHDAYAALTNNPNIPNSWWITTSPTTTTKVTVIPPRPQQPRSLMRLRPQPNYIEPYRAANWYAAKPHYGDNLLLDPD